MNVLVTGASGFLGRHVVAAFLRNGHRVRVLVRDPEKAAQQPWHGRVETCVANLRGREDLLPALAGMDVLVHLATAMTGDDSAIFAGSVVGTERLFEAVGRSAVRRLVLCSSFSIYDFVAARSPIDEATPIARDIYRNGGYAAAKLWQERLAQRLHDAHGVALTVVRPGLIWGRDNECQGCLGMRVGRLQFVVGAGRRVRLTHADNCADIIRRATEDPRAIGQVLNVVDDPAITAWRYAGQVARMARAARGSTIRICLPFWLARGLVSLVRFVSSLVFGPDGRLPSLFRREEFAARFRPFQYRTEKLRELLRWSPPVAFEECLRRTFGPNR